MSLKLRLQQQDCVYGLFCSTPASLTIELIAAAGYDFVIIDLEHTLIGPEQLSAMLLAARAGNVAALVRIAAPHQAAQALDAGAEGIVLPRIGKASDAREAVRQCHYAPIGLRGLNATWRSRYGRDDLVQTLLSDTASTLVIAMIEDQAGVDNAEQIAAEPGIDVVLEGAADLSQSMGLPWQVRHPDVRQALLSVSRAAQKHGKTFCALPRAPRDIVAWRREGTHMFVLGDDRGIARRAMAERLKQHHEIWVSDESTNS